MKYNKYYYMLFIPAALALFLISCSTYKTYTSATSDINNSSLIEIPTLVEIEVINDMPVCWRSESLPKGLGLNETKEMAVAEALQNIDGDFMLDPKFEVSFRGKKIKGIEVSGYCAKYKNFRPFEAADTLLLMRRFTGNNRQYILVDD